MHENNSLSELQLLFMDHERSIETLSEQLLNQERNMAQLVHRLEVLEQKVSSIMGHGEDQMQMSREKPPHY